jgi:hypothetical protein
MPVLLIRMSKKCGFVAMVCAYLYVYVCMYIYMYLYVHMCGCIIYI